MKQSLTNAKIDQLESFLQDNIGDVIKVVEGPTIDELAEKHGALEAYMLVYVYSTLVMKITDPLITKIEQIKKNTPD